MKKPAHRRMWLNPHVVRVGKKTTDTIPIRLAAFVIGLLLAFVVLQVPAWQRADPGGPVPKQSTEDRSRV